MPGFLGAIGPIAPQGFEPEIRANLLQESKTGQGWFIERRTLNKFISDKPFYEDSQYLMLVEGVILNRKALETQYRADSFSDVVIAAYEKSGETFFNAFRGSFSGLFYDKKKDLWLIFTNHIGDKQVFYTSYERTFVFGSEPGFVVGYCKRNNYPLTLNRDAAYMLFTYGFFIENHTLACEIKKLTAGHYLKIFNGKTEEIQYHRFKNDPDHSKTEAEWIEGIDHYFRKAIKRQFDKDLEYGYKHITTLSGGLDSRMTVWVAHELGYTEQLNTTFSQSNYLDETISKKIATDLKHEWLFKALDHGNFLKNIDEISRITYGGGSYAGLAHGKSMYDLVDFEPFGIAHTGQIGDAIIGTFYQKPVAGTPHKIGDGAYSQTLIERLNDYQFVYDYPNMEIFSLYSRAFTGANQGLLIFQEKTESVSPFTDVDFLEFCYSIPVELRYKHKIYFDWILQKYPGAAAYPWEKINDLIHPIPAYEAINILGKKVQKGYVAKWLKGAVVRRLPFKRETKKIDPLHSQKNMNPFDYWINTNECLRNFLNSYYKENISLLNDDMIKNDCCFLYDVSSAGVRLQVLTFLSALKIHSL